MSRLSRLLMAASAFATTTAPFAADAARLSQPAPAAALLVEAQFMPANELSGAWDVAVAYGGSNCRAAINLVPLAYAGMPPTFSGAGYLTCPINNYSAYNTFMLTPRGGSLYTLNMTAPGEQSWVGNLTLSGGRYLQGWVGPSGREYYLVMTRR